jgi:integrase/recombinase XerD
MPPLRQKYIRDLTIRGKAENTQQVYTACVADLASYYNRSPDLLTYDQVADWLFHLRDERKLASSSVNIAVSAARFLYRTTLGRDTAELLAKVHASSARPNAPTPTQSRKSKPFSRLRAVHVTSRFCARCMAAAYG